MTGQQLKNSILQWAIEGKLVPQIESEGTAEDLLKEIRAEKERLVKEGKLKKKDLEVKPIEEDEIPFEIPSGWRWCNVKDILIKITDGTHHSPVSKPTGDFMYVTAKNIKDKGVITDNITYVDAKVHEEIFSRCDPELGDLLYIKDGATTGVVTINNIKEPFSLLSSVALLKPSTCVFNKYIMWFLRSNYCYQTIRSTMKGTGITRITLTKIEQWILPLPPLAEQHRIVSKIEELMPLVEEYGKAQERLETLNRELPEKLKKSVLQEAIMGKLVPQDPKEGTAEELLAEIRKEKEKLVKEGKLKKKDLEIKPIEEDEIPFEIPEGWRWCRLGEICSFLSRGKSPSYSDVPNQYPVFAQKCNLKEGGISLEQARFLRPDTIDKWKEEYRLKTDDVLVNSTGTGIVCRTRLYNESFQGNYPFVVPDSHVSVVRTFDSICSSYIYFLFNSKEYQDYWDDRLAGSTNQKELYIGTLYDTIVPLPPLSEQKRIVAKLEEVMEEIEGMKK